ncbi:hypothetical protein NECID01_2029 [Nematocida sp. AWRm77]|nr:hypothetical protein NECID01_2029 [Nematocida sp. AWRm77]
MRDNIYLDETETDKEIMKRIKKRKSEGEDAEVENKLFSEASPKETDIYIKEDFSKMSSFNILANCAAKELRLLSKAKGDGEKENTARVHVDSSASDIDDELDIEFPIVVSGGKRLFKCIYPECRKAFPSLSRMRRHYIIHTGAKPFKCLNAECPKSFSRRDNMIQHYKGHCIFTKRYPRKF